MNKELRNIINKYRENESTLNQILVTVFVRMNIVKVKNNLLITSLLLPEDSPLIKGLIDSKLNLSFDDLIEAYELAIPTKEKVINGAVYTPKYIKNFIVEHSLKMVTKQTSLIKAADISCGCGAFLFTLANIIKSKTTKTYYDIFRNHIYGVDISSSSIIRSKILLTLLALVNGEDRKVFHFNLYCDNSLSFDWSNQDTRIKLNGGFDLIVGNPPYVRAKNIDVESKKLISNWLVTKSGNPDLYIPFFEIGMSELNNLGVLGFITVNSFYKSINARKLREYFQKERYDIKIIDFGHEKLFSNISSYTCICIISKNKSELVSFKKENTKTLTTNGLNNFNKILYGDLDSHKGWLLNDNNIIKNIKQIEKTGEPLGTLYKIKNGLATLSNDLYIFKPTESDEQYYSLIRNGVKYDIEKSICKDIIKPNILKYEHEIDDIKEKIIYPYNNGISTSSLLDEKYFKRTYPKAYFYLASFKDKLLSRDKGKGDYGAWYAYGRTQALNNKGLKLLFPYMAKKPYFVFTDNIDMLIYCGYAIFGEFKDELIILKRILESKVFEYYITYTSKPYSAGYFSFAKNYVKNFGVCKLNPVEKNILLKSSDVNEINKLLIKKYNINI